MRVIIYKTKQINMLKKMLFASALMADSSYSWWSIYDSGMLKADACISPYFNATGLARHAKDPVARNFFYEKVIRFGDSKDAYAHFSYLFADMFNINLSLCTGHWLLHGFGLSLSPFAWWRNGALWNFKKDDRATFGVGEQVDFTQAKEEGNDSEMHWQVDLASAFAFNVYVPYFTLRFSGADMLFYWSATKDQADLMMWKTAMYALTVLKLNFCYSDSKYVNFAASAVVNGVMTWGAAYIYKNQVKTN